MKFLTSIGSAVLLLCISVLLPCAGLRGEEQANTTQYDELSPCIVRLEHVDTVIRAGQDSVLHIPQADGTGFVVNYGGGQYVVTARHVAELPYDLQARVTSATEDNRKRQVKKLIIPRKAWVFHPQNPTPDTNYVDVAVAQLPLPFIDAFDSTELNREQDLIPPEEVVVFGYPLDIGFYQTEQRPLARSGAVATEAGSKLRGQNRKFFRERTVLLDVKVFPGNSGSPVLGRSEGSHRLCKYILGLITESNISLDYAVCEPASRIRETLEHALKHPAPPDAVPKWLP